MSRLSTPALIVSSALAVLAVSADILQLRSVLWDPSVPLLVLVLVGFLFLGTLDWGLALRRKLAGSGTRAALARRLCALADEDLRTPKGGTGHMTTPSNAQRRAIKRVLPELRAELGVPAVEALEKALDETSTRVAVLRIELRSCADALERGDTEGSGNLVP